MASPETKRPRTTASLFLLVLVLVQAAVIVGFLVARRPSCNPPVPPTPALRLLSTNQAEPYYAGNPGPWGEVAFAHINIEPPDDFVQVDDRTFEPTRWFFGGRTRADVVELFRQCDLTREQHGELSDSAAWLADTNGVIITPSEQLILGMSAAARAKIYNMLAEDERNDFHRWPFTHHRDDFDGWFSGKGLSEATLALVKRLTYERGTSLCFSDLPEAFAQILTIEERRRLLKTLSRNSTLLMKLRVRPDSDVGTLADYWGKGRRSKDLKPLLESLTRVSGGITMDISHLLPPFARKRLYTYPPLAASPPPDCYWTAFNFYNDMPDDRFFNETEWQAELEKNYTPVLQPSFGDIILLLRPNNVPIHAAVYVADDIVFTKNGGSERQPWLFMKWDSMLAHYPENFQVRAIILHPKNLKEPL